MTVSNVYVLHGINISSVGFISQITNARPSPAIEQILAKSAGYPYPLFVGNMGQKPMVSFDTTQVATILGITGIGLADLTSYTVDLYYKLTTNRGSRVADASGSHYRFRMANAVLSCDRISAGHRSEATASCTLYNPYDGANEPIVPAGSVSLAGTPTSSEHYVCGPCSFNGTDFEGVQDFSLDFGRSLIQAGDRGELYDTFIAEQELSPSVSVKSLGGVPWFGAGLNGTALTSMTCYLRRLATTGRVANGTASHIAFTATAGLVVAEDSSGGGNDPTVTSIRAQLISQDSSSSPIAISVGTAIS